MVWECRKYFELGSMSISKVKYVFWLFMHVACMGVQRYVGKWMACMCTCMWRSKDDLCSLYQLPSMLFIEVVTLPQARAHPSAGLASKLASGFSCLCWDCRWATTSVPVLCGEPNSVPWLARQALSLPAEPSPFKSLLWLSKKKI